MTLVAALAVGSGDLELQSEPARVRVFLETVDGGHPDELDARRESLKQLGEALARRKKLVATVGQEELADIRVEVVERRIDVPRVVVGIGGRPGQPPGAGGPARVAQLLVRLRWREGTVDFVNKNKPLESPRGWKAAADDIANQLEKWIGERRARLVIGRESSSWARATLTSPRSVAIEAR